MAKYRVYPEKLIGIKKKAVAYKKIPTPKPPALKLPNYELMFSDSKTNGVYMLNSSSGMIASDKIDGPLGIDLRLYRDSNYATKDISACTVVWQSPKVFIIYGEASPKTEESWLSKSNLSASILWELLEKIAQATGDRYGEADQVLAKQALDGLGLDKKFLLSLRTRSRGKRLHAEDEAIIAKQFIKGRPHFIGQEDI